MILEDMEVFNRLNYPTDTHVLTFPCTRASDDGKLGSSEFQTSAVL